MRLPLGKRIKAWLTNHLQITIPSPSPFERLMDEAAPVFCRVLAPDGRPVRKRVSVTIHFGHVGEPRVRTVDLRDHELLKPMR